MPANGAGQTERGFQMARKPQIHVVMSRSDVRAKFRWYVTGADADAVFGDIPATGAVLRRVGDDGSVTIRVTVGSNPSAWRTTLAFVIR